MYSGWFLAGLSYVKTYLGRVMAPPHTTRLYLRTYMRGTVSGKSLLEAEIITSPSSQYRKGLSCCYESRQSPPRYQWFATHAAHGHSNDNDNAVVSTSTSLLHQPSLSSYTIRAETSEASLYPQVHRLIHETGQSVARHKPQRALLPGTVFPGGDAWLPVESDILDKAGKKEGGGNNTPPDAEASVPHYVPVSSLSCADVRGFGRAAQGAVPASWAKSSKASASHASVRGCCTSGHSMRLSRRS